MEDPEEVVQEPAALGLTDSDGDGSDPDQTELARMRLCIEFVQQCLEAFDRRTNLDCAASSGEQKPTYK